MKRKWDSDYGAQKKRMTGKTYNQAKGSAVGALSALKMIAQSMGVPKQVSNNIKVSGNINRFQSSGGNEKKYWDSYTTGGVRALVKTGDSIYYDAVPSAISVVSNISRGTGPDQRVGNLITVKSLNFKTTVVLGAAAPSSSFSGSYKIFIVLDKQANGTTPSVLDIWERGVSTPGVTASINSNLNITNSSRFQILKLFKGSLQVTPYYDSTVPQLGRGSASRLINFSMKCNIPIKYSNTNTSGANSGITDNNIWIFAFSDDIGDTQLQVINPITRIRYTDN